MSGHFRYSRTLDSNQIRVLNITSTADFSLSGTLKELPFDRGTREFHDFSSMYALSYCWGQESPTEKLIINGQEFPIRESLLTALKQILQYTRERLGKSRCSFWIDAICINQEDDAEKAAQLDVMSDIYSKMSVLIWLGEEGQGSDAVMDVFHWLELELNRKVKSKKQRVNSTEAVSSALQRAKATADMSEENLDSLTRYFLHMRSRGYFTDLSYELGEHCPPEEHPWWDSFLSLATRRWFSRVWTLQESVLPSNTVVLCGTRAVNWSFFKDCRSAFLVHFRLYQMRWDDDNKWAPERKDELSRHILFGSTLRHLFSADNDHGIDVLRKILARGDCLNASHPKDYIYGFLGLVGVKVHREMKKDYRESYPTARVFEQATELCCRIWPNDFDRARGHEWWVSLCEDRLYKYPKRTVGLASWCVDFVPGHGQRLKLTKAKLSAEDNDVSEEVAERWSCRELRITPSMGCSSELVVSGFHVDTIRKSSSQDFCSRPAECEGTELAGYAFHWMAHVLESVGEEFADEWLAKFLQPSAEKEEQFPAGDLQATIDTLSRYRQTARSQSEGSNEELLAAYVAKVGTEYLSKFMRKHGTTVFFTTAGGRLGRSLQACKPGQLLCYFPSGDVFHMLEPVAAEGAGRGADDGVQQYRHVGLAVIHGLGGDGLDQLGYTNADQQKFRII